MTQPPFNALLIDMHELGISQMVCSTVLGKYAQSRLKCALEAMHGKNFQNVDDALLSLLEGCAPLLKDEAPPKLLPDKRPTTNVERCAVPSPLETMASLNAIVAKSDRATGLNALRALRESLTRK